MHLESCCQSVHHRAWREYCNRRSGSQVEWPGITFWPPSPEAAAVEEKGFVLEDNERTLRERIEGSLIGNPRPIRVEPFSVKDGIYFLGGGSEASRQTRIGLTPAGAELLVALPLTIGAGPVTCGERCRFIQEEEFCPASGLHQFPVPAFVLQKANNPTTRLIKTPNTSSFVVEASAVAKPFAAGRCSDD